MTFQSITNQRSNEQRIAKDTARFWSNVALTADIDRCWNWQAGHHTKGYGRARFNGRNVRAHRLAWELVNGREPSQWILHSCDNRLCVNPNHLREGDGRDNADDRGTRNRQAQGERHGMAKLSLDTVRLIKLAISHGVKCHTIAKLLGMDQSSIYYIKNGKTWAHVQI